MDWFFGGGRRTENADEQPTTYAGRHSDASFSRAAVGRRNNRDGIFSRAAVRRSPQSTQERELRSREISVDSTSNRAVSYAVPEDHDAYIKPQLLTSYIAASMVGYGRLPTAGSIFEEAYKGNWHSVWPRIVDVNERDKGTTSQEEETLPHIAAKTGNLEATKILVEQYNADPNVVEVKRKNTPIMFAATKGYLEIVKFLHEHGSDANIPNEVEATPVFLAGQQGFIEIVRYLVEVAKVDIHHVDIHERTALQLAGQQAGDRREILEIFLSHGASMATVNNRTERNSPLSAAIRFGSIENIQYLLNQKWSEIPREDLDRCTKLAAELGMTSVVMESLRIRNGDKFSDEVSSKTRKLVTTRSIAIHLSNQFVADEEETGNSRFQSSRCGSDMYHNMKTLVLHSLNHAEPFSDDMLLAIATHAQLHHPEDFTEIWDVILEVTRRCIDARPRTSKLFVWFEEYLVPSAIWFDYVPLTAERRSSLTLIDPTARKRQSRFEQLCKMATDNQEANAEIGAGYPILSPDEIEILQKAVQPITVTQPEGEEVRQDAMPNGVKVLDDPFVTSILESVVQTESKDDEKSTTSELPRLQKKITIKSVLESDVLSADDIFLLDSYDQHVYLNRLVALCKGMFGSFKKEMEHIVEQMSLRYTDIVPHRLKVAPIKDVVRAKEKIGTDYYNEKIYPKSARILDLLRCSIVFMNVNELAEGLKFLTSYANQGGSSSESEWKGRMIGIARVKSLFALDRPGYKDVKVNLIFESAKFGKSVICEVQLILKSFLDVKKDLHKLYAITRTADVFEMVKRRVGSHVSHDERVYAYHERMLYQSARVGDERSVSLALLLGATVDSAPQGGGVTALMKAAETGNVGIILLLLRNGANINATDELERTAAMFAAWRDQADALKVMLEWETSCDLTCKSYMRWEDKENHGRPYMTIYDWAITHQAAKVLELLPPRIL